MATNGLAFLDEAGGNKSRVILWTPKMAESAFMEHNSHDKQRGFRKTHAEMLKRQMDDGLWRQPWFQTWIAFESGTRHVVNGQHTLWAIWQHGKPVSVNTAWNLDSSAMASFDCFKARGMGVLTQQAGMDYAKHRNAVTRLRMAIDFNAGVHCEITTNEVYALTVEDVLMDQCIRAAAGNATFKEIRSAAAVEYAMWRIASVHGFETATKFMEETMIGANMARNDPRLHLGRFLRQKVHHTFGDRYLVVVGIIRCFNMVLSGATVETSGLIVKSGAKIPDVYGFKK